MWTNIKKVATHSSYGYKWMYCNWWGLTQSMDIVEETGWNGLIKRKLSDLGGWPQTTSQRMANQKTKNSFCIHWNIQRAQKSFVHNKRIGILQRNSCLVCIGLIYGVSNENLNISVLLKCEIMMEPLEVMALREFKQNNAPLNKRGRIV